MRRSKALRRTPSILIQLPLMDANVAIYALGVTGDPQQNGYSQVDELRELAYSYGYAEEQIALFLDKEAPGTPLARREGYAALMQAISEGNATIIFISDIALFFADASEELDFFIVAGMRKGIFVITLEAVFSFSSLTSIGQFRKMCTRAGEPSQLAIQEQETNGHRKQGNIEH